MGKKKPKPAISQYYVAITATFRTTWTVEASSVEEANEKFDQCRDIVDEGMNGAEMVNWERKGDARSDH